MATALASGEGCLCVCQEVVAAATAWQMLPQVAQLCPVSASNSHEKYRNEAEGLHALIVARTGPPLRELRANAVLVGQA